MLPGASTNPTIVLTVFAAPVGAAWVTHRRDLYRQYSVPLPRESRERLAPFFDRALLNRVEVAHVDRIADPLGALPSRLKPRGMLDLSTVRGMAFIDTIVLASGNASCNDDTSILFHELVHIVQYQLLGTAGFIRAYLAGWLGAGRSYLANPLEVMAFDLQERFDREPNGGFDVRREVRRSLGLPKR